MATLFKVQKKHAAKIEAKERKESTNVKEKFELKRPREEDDEEMADVDMSEPPKKRRNKQRVLMLCSRGVTQRMRHLMNDLEVLLPQVKKGAFQSCLKVPLVRNLNTFQSPSLMQKANYICSVNFPTCTIATTPCSSRREGMRIYICGQSRVPMGPAYGCTYRTSIRWTS